MDKTRMPTEQEVAERNFSEEEIAEMKARWLQAEWDELDEGDADTPSPPVDVKKKK